MEAGREEVGYESVQLPDSGFAVVESCAVERWGVSGWEAEAEWVIDRCRCGITLEILTIVVERKWSESRGARVS